MTKARQEQLLDLFCESVNVGCRRAEDYIAARDVGLNVVKTAARASILISLLPPTLIPRRKATYLFCLGIGGFVPPPRLREGAGGGVDAAPVLSPRGVKHEFL